MEIFVYGRSAIEAVKPHDVPHIIISITSGPNDVARLRTTQACRGILRLFFLDADVPSDRHAEADLFSEEQAARVWSFVLQHRAQIERVIVHCDAGMSRSPAVAAAISRALTGDDGKFFGGRYRPNMRVYRTLLKAYERVVP
jgi:predicted protein tyrosine phosphatase